MAEVTQVYDLLNQTASEAIGESAITVKDTSTLVSLGNQIFSTQDNTDAFFNKLPDVIGRVYVKYMQIKRDDRGIVRTPLDFGIILERIGVKSIAKAEKNISWEKQPDPYAPEKMEDKTDLMVNLISSIDTFSVDKVIYENQMRTAFNSAARMGAFVEMIFEDMYNGMTKALNQANALTECTAIAQSLSAKGFQRYNLLTEYNTETNSSLTVSSARRDKDFILWAMKRIKEVMNRAKKLSVLYNVTGAERELNDSDLRIHILSDFASDTNVYANSSTYHKELVELYGYEEVTDWQGLSNNPTFENVSTINIENGEINIKQTGVVAHIFARDRMATMIDFIRTKSDYIPTAERTLYSHKADIGYAILPDEIGIVFYIAEDSNDNAK